MFELIWKYSFQGPYYIGGATVAYYGYQTFKQFYHALFDSQEQNLIEKYGRCYALITGDSYEYGSELCKRGLHLILVGKAACDQAQNLKQKYIYTDIQTLNYETIEDYQEKLKKFKDQKIHIHLNNSIYEKNQKMFHEIEPEELKRQIEQNIIPFLCSVQVLYPQLADKKALNLIIDAKDVANVQTNPHYVGINQMQSYVVQSLRNFYKFSLNMTFKHFYQGPFDQNTVWDGNKEKMAKENIRKLGFLNNMYGQKRHVLWNFINGNF